MQIDTNPEFDNWGRLLEAKAGAKGVYENEWKDCNKNTTKRVEKADSQNGSKEAIKDHDAWVGGCANSQGTELAITTMPSLPAVNQIMTLDKICPRGSFIWTEIVRIKLRV